MTGCRAVSLGLVLVAALMVTVPAAAQIGWGVGAGATTTVTTVRRATSSGGEVLSGIVVGGEGRLTAGRFTLHLAYAEGSLRTEGGAPGQPYVEGSAALGVVPLPGLSVAVGPHARAYIVDAVPQRRLLSRLHVRYAATVVGDAIRGYVEGWTGFVHAPSGRAAGTWRGGGVGVSLHPAGRTLTLRLSYAIDRAHADDAAGPETVQGLTFALTVGRP